MSRTRQPATTGIDRKRRTLTSGVHGSGMFDHAGGGMSGGTSGQVRKAEHHRNDLPKTTANHMCNRRSHRLHKPLPPKYLAMVRTKLTKNTAHHRPRSQSLRTQGRRGHLPWTAGGRCHARDNTRKTRRGALRYTSWKNGGSRARHHIAQYRGLAPSIAMRLTRHGNVRVLPPCSFTGSGLEQLVIEITSELAEDLKTRTRRHAIYARAWMTWCSGTRTDN